MKKTTGERYPVITYLLMAVAVAVLCVEVTFARYATSSSGSGTVGVAPFAVSYDVTGVSSETYSNLNFYFEDSESGSKSQMGTVQTLSFAVRNYDGDVISGVDVQPTLRLRFPQVLAECLALQLTYVDGNGAETVESPQLVISEIVTAAKAGNDNNSKTYTAGEDYSSKEYTGSVSTSGKLTETDGAAAGTVVLTGENGLCVTLSAYTEESGAYSVVFPRKDAGGWTEVLYLDCGMANMPMYELAFTCGDMVLMGGSKCEKTFHLDVAVTESLKYKNFLGVTEDSVKWDDSYLTSPAVDSSDGPGSEGDTDNWCAARTGWHFDQTVDSYSSAEEGVSSSGAAVVRVERTFSDNGTNYYIVSNKTSDGVYTVISRHKLEESGSGWLSYNDVYIDKNDIQTDPQETAEDGSAGVSFNSYASGIYFGVLTAATFVQVSEVG